MYGLLILLGVVCVGFGAYNITEATLGVGSIAAGCFCGILARIAQAHEQHAALMKQLRGEPEVAS